MKFMTTLQRSHELGANATGMNMAKNQQVFLNLERQWGPQNTMEKLVDDKEITDQTHILENISEFYETLFKTQAQKAEKEMEIFQWCWYSKTLWKSSKTFVRKI